MWNYGFSFFYYYSGANNNLDFIFCLNHSLAQKVWAGF